MPPRHAYWTILIDDKPTAFRAREREELQPTFVQLQRKNANAVMRWFARGKLWPSREAERDDFQMQRQAASAPRARTAAPTSERRGSDWRPGGTHKDPRDRFKKKNRPERAWSEKDPATQRERDRPGYQAARPRAPREDRPWKNQPRGDQDRNRTPPSDGRWRDKPSGEAKRPWGGKPGDRKPWENARPPNNDRPWQTKPTGPRAQRAPWVGKPQGDRKWGAKPAAVAPRTDRPWRDKPPSAPRGDRPFGDRRPWDGKPRGDKPGGFRANEPSRGGRKPWSAKPGGSSSGDRPWSAKPPGGGDRKPWQKKAFRPSGPPRPDARKRRDDEPPDRD